MRYPSLVGLKEQIDKQGQENDLRPLPDAPPQAWAR